MISDPDANGLSENTPASDASEETAEIASADDHAIGDRLTSDRPTNDRLPNERGASSGEQLYKIREILFGEQMTAQRERFERLESRMSQDFRALREDLTRQMSAVEDRLLRKVDDIAQQLETERDRREESIEQVAQQLEENTSGSGQRIDHLDSQMNERMTSIAQDLQAEIEHQRRSLQAHLEDKIDAITDTLSQEANERKVSADNERANLSALFANLSEQLQPMQAAADQAAANNEGA